MGESPISNLFALTCWYYHAQVSQFSVKLLSSHKQVEVFVLHYRLSSSR
jgi:hypothetical protein